MPFRMLLAAIALVVATPLSAQTFDTEKGRISVSTVAGGLDQPWGIDFLPDGRMIVTEKSGQLRIVSADGKVSAYRRSTTAAKAACWMSPCTRISLPTVWCFCPSPKPDRVAYQPLWRAAG